MSAEDTAKYDQEYQNYRRFDVAERLFRAMPYLDSVLNSGKAVFGPIFNVQTSDTNHNLIVDLISKGLVAAGSSSAQDAASYFLVAKTTKGEVVGLRKTSLYDFGEYMDGSGEVMTLPVVPGTGSALELVNILIVQQEANLRNKPIIYTVDPANPKRLEEVASLIDGSFHYKEKLRYFELYQRKLEEFKRWSALFGNNGILGFTDWIRRFEASSQSLALGEYVSINLGRSYEETAEGRRLVQPIVEGLEKSDEFTDQSITEQIFRNSVLPQLEEIASPKNNSWKIL